MFGKTPTSGASFYYVARVIAACCLIFGGISVASASLPPVYVHMNGANDFLESVVVVRPGQPVVWVNQDTGPHIIEGYNPMTGRRPLYLDKRIEGTPGAGHKVHTVEHVFRRIGIHYYFCPVHAHLVKVFGARVQPAKRTTVGGFGGAMRGLVIVTRDPALLKENPPSSRKKILPHFFGG